jgi:hypothetical protein
LKYLRAENSRLKANIALNSCKGLFNANDPLMKKASKTGNRFGTSNGFSLSHSTEAMSGSTVDTTNSGNKPAIPPSTSVNSSTASTAKAAPELEKIPEIIRDTRTLLLEAQDLGVQAKVVDLTLKKPERGTWRSSKSDPVIQHKLHANKVIEMARRSAVLRDAVREAATKVAVVNGGGRGNSVVDAVGQKVGGSSLRFVFTIDSLTSYYLT